MKNLPDTYDKLVKLRKFEIAVVIIIFIFYLIWFFIDVHYSKTLNLEELIAN